MIEQLKQIQRGFFDDKGLSDFEITRPHGTGKLYEFLIHYKMGNMAQLAGTFLPGENLLNVCCGSGMEAEYFAKLGATVVGMDLSSFALQGAKKRARRFEFSLKTIAGDAECLPFRSESFDFVFVHDGLHHLPQPEKAIKEMVRVARKGIFFTEPADAFVTRIAVKLGIASDFEEAENFVYRFSTTKLKVLFSRLGLNHMRFKRYGMWYSHYPPRWFRVFESTFMYILFKIFFFLGNIVLSRFGNKLAVVAWKNDDQNKIKYR